MKLIQHLSQTFFKWIRTYPLFSALLLFLIAMIVYQRLPIFLEDKKHINRPAPDFHLFNLQGRQINLNSQRGKVVILNFWATWCLPCRLEIPLLRSIYNELEGHPFEILAITMEDKETVLRFSAENSVSYPILIDTHGAVMRKYRIVAFPTLVVISKEGRIIDISHGLDPLLKWKIRRFVTGSFF